MRFRWPCCFPMAHEEHNLSSSGIRLSKKSRQNKVPQRGMGVAQLEKIILEEKQSKDVSFRPPAVSVPIQRPLIAKSDHGFVSKPMVSSSSGSSTNGRSRLWRGGEYSFGGEKENPNPDQDRVHNRGMDQRGYVVPMPMNLGGLPYESSPTVWPVVPSTTQRSHVNQSCSSTMKEPPSNQSYCSNKYSSIWPEEEKYEQIVGLKRSYPFSVENMPIPSFNCKFPPAYVSPMARSGETTSCSNGGITSLDLPIPIFREKSLSLGAKTDQPSKKLMDKNHGLTKDFLTLAPPRASPRSHSNSKEKLTPLSVGELSISPYQGETGDTFGTQLLNQKQPLHSFFPVAKTHGNNNGEAGEQVDLNLKL